MTLPMPPLARDLTILHARVGLGIVFLAHGRQMLTTNGRFSIDHLAFSRRSRRAENAAA